METMKNQEEKNMKEWTEETVKSWLVDILPEDQPTQELAIKEAAKAEGITIPELMQAVGGLRIVRSHGDRIHRAWTRLHIWTGEEIKDWLENLIPGEGTRVSTQQIKDQAKAAGIDIVRLGQVRRDIGIICRNGEWFRPHIWTDEEIKDWLLTVLPNKEKYIKAAAFDGSMSIEQLERVRRDLGVRSGKGGLADREWYIKRVTIWTDEEIKDWLRGEIPEDGERLEKEIKADAMAEGIPIVRLETIRRSIGVRSSAAGLADRVWFWKKDKVMTDEETTSWLIEQMPEDDGSIKELEIKRRAIRDGVFMETLDRVRRPLGVVVTEGRQDSREWYWKWNKQDIELWLFKNINGFGAWVTETMLISKARKAHIPEHRLREVFTHMDGHQIRTMEQFPGELVWTLDTSANWVIHWLRNRELPEVGKYVPESKIFQDAKKMCLPTSYVASLMLYVPASRYEYHKELCWMRER